MGDLAKEINSKFANERVKALLNIKYTAGWLDQIGAEIMKPYKISEQQYNILRILKGAGKAITVNEVKERMIQKSPNTTRLMDKLFDKQLIIRTRCENDRRVVYVKITKDGTSLLDKISMAKFDDLLKALSEKEAKTLNTLLDKIR
jgi:DNA-binding MarR family transcriptional regulator